MVRSIAVLLILSSLMVSIGCITIQTQAPAQQSTQPTQSTASQSAAALPEIIVFSANPPAITTGSSTTLLWNVSKSNSVIISPSIGTVQPAGNLSISPAATTNYTITASNAAGTATATIQVSVAAAPTVPALSGIPVIQSFTASPANIVAGESSTISWSVLNANSATIIPTVTRNPQGIVDAAGSASVTPSVTTTYILTAVNNSGTISRSIVIAVSSQPAISMPLNWAGTWDTNWGTMYLSQSMGHVTGTYAHDTGKIAGGISKNLTGDILVGTWSEAPTYAPPNDAGDIMWVASPDFNSFTGKWRYGSGVIDLNADWDGTWSGKRKNP